MFEMDFSHDKHWHNVHLVKGSFGVPYKKVLTLSALKYFYISHADQGIFSILKHTTTLFSLSDHHILSREWRVIVDLVQTNNYYHGRGLWYYNQSGVTELLIMWHALYVRMCFKSVKTLGVLHSYL